MKTAIVTGASSGIGKECARLLAARGYMVYDFSRSGHDTAEIHHLTVDVTDEAAVTAAFAAVAAAQPSIDVLVNNAGFGISGPIEYTALADATRQFDVNFFGCFVCSKAAIPYLRASKGRIVNVSSVAAVFSIPFQSFYSASKAAINSLSLCLSSELRPFGISVCAVMPGDVKTGFTAARKKNETGGDRYAHLQHAVQAMEHDEENGISPERVARCLVKAVTRRHPAPFSVVGGKYKAFAFLGRILPYRLQNFIVGKLYQ